MRIAKVALAFFSIGFLAGSFERAAGLGHSEVSRSAAQERQVGAAVAQGTLTVMASFGIVRRRPARGTICQPPASPDVPDAVSAGLSELMAEPRCWLTERAAGMPMPREVPLS